MTSRSGSASGRTWRLGDEEDRVGARRSRLPHLVEVDDEVLAKDRQLHRVADRMDVLEAPAEEALVGEARDGRGAVLGVGARDRDGIEVLADHARGRAHPLHLGDRMGRVGVAAVDDGLEEVSRAAELRDPLLQLAERHAGLRRGDLGRRVLEDVLENRLHAV